MPITIALVAGPDQAFGGQWNRGGVKKVFTCILKVVCESG